MLIERHQWGNPISIVSLHIPVFYAIGLASDCHTLLTLPVIKGYLIRQNVFL